MSYAYRDKYGILHGTDDYLTALKKSRDGRIFETDLPCNGKYFMINNIVVVDYGNGDIYLGGNKKDGWKVSPAEFKQYLQPIWDVVGIY